MASKVVVPASGGLDSTTCMAIAPPQGFELYALTFDYGQRHCWEMAATERVAQAPGAAGPEPRRSR